MIKVFTDHKAAADFQTRVEGAAQRSNDLLSIWHEFQPFHRCTDIETFEQIASAPGAMFDAVLIDAVQMTVKGGLKPSAEQVAKLYNIDRENFYNLCEGRAVKLETCAPCQRAKAKPGKTSISLAEFRKYEPYLIFDEGEFIINTETLEEHQKQYDFYATSPAQLNIVKHYDDLTAILNKHCSEYEVTDRVKETIATSFHLLLSNGISGDFVTDPEYIKNAIFNK